MFNVVGTWWYLVIIGWYWLNHYGTGSVQDGTGQNLVVLSQYRVEGGIGWCLMVLVSRRHYWLLLGCTGSIQVGTGRFSVIMDQKSAALVASVICFQKIFGLHGLNHQIIEYLVSRGRYWLVLGVTGSEQGGTGCQHDELSENIWFAWSKPSNH